MLLAKREPNTTTGANPPTRMRSAQTLSGVTPYSRAGLDWFALCTYQIPNPPAAVLEVKKIVFRFSPGSNWLRSLLHRYDGFWTSKLLCQVRRSQPSTLC
jgi:hypothetical protein